MTSKEEAFKMIQNMGLVNWKYDGSVTIPFDLAKKYALVAVEYLIKDELMHTNGDVDPTRYWTEVKSEIENYTL